MFTKVCLLFYGGQQIKKIILTKGLPGSGKSTWALDFIKKNPDYKRINKDELRAMVDAGKWTHKNEKIILNLRDLMVKNFLDLGYSVIIDDTNFNLVHEARMRAIAATNDTQVVIQDFTDVPLEECIDRDLKRSNSVGHKVIKGMWRQFIRPAAEKPVINDDLPWCIICDIDGTIAENVSGRSPYDMRKVGEDKIKDPIRSLVNTHYEFDHAPELIFFSGRDETARRETIKWLDDNDIISFAGLYMRAEGDNRKDAIVKRELYDQHIRGKYNVLFVVDDRDQVVDMWRNELGLTCLQVAEGDF